MAVKYSGELTPAAPPGVFGVFAAWKSRPRYEEPDPRDSLAAALVECIASSRRAFLSSISVSVAAPTVMTATPPSSFPV
jgi:hypothetical protein